MLVLAIVTAAAILTAVAVVQRGGSDAETGPTGNVADCANAFNFGDAIACTGERERATPK